jgi:Chlorophyll A-B binding protein
LEAPPNLEGYPGNAGFDPFRFSDFVPMDFLAEAEIKHGRICMMATVGFLAVDSGLRVYPLPDGYEGLTALTAHDALVKQGAMQQLFLWIAIAEVIDTIAIVQMLNGSGRKPADFGFDPLGFMKNKSPEEKMKLQVNEIKNGRLAMLAFSGIVTQSVLYGTEFPYVV